MNQAFTPIYNMRKEDISKTWYTKWQISEIRESVMFIAKLLILPQVLVLLPARQSDLKMTIMTKKLSLYRAPTRALLFLSQNMVSMSLHHNWLFPTTQASLHLYSAAGTTIPIEEIVFEPDTHEDPTIFDEDHDIDELASQLDIAHHATELTTFLGGWDAQEVPFL
jgi:hypothetical protein